MTREHKIRGWYRSKDRQFRLFLSSQSIFSDRGMLKNGEYRRIGFYFPRVNVNSLLADLKFWQLDCKISFRVFSILFLILTESTDSPKTPKYFESSMKLSDFWKIFIVLDKINEALIFQNLLFSVNCLWATFYQATIPSLMKKKKLKRFMSLVVSLFSLVTIIALIRTTEKRVGFALCTYVEREITKVWRF